MGEDLDQGVCLFARRLLLLLLIYVPGGCDVCVEYWCGAVGVGMIRGRYSTDDFVVDDCSLCNLGYNDFKWANLDGMAWCAALSLTLSPCFRQ